MQRASVCAMSLIGTLLAAAGGAQEAPPSPRPAEPALESPGTAPPEPREETVGPTPGVPTIGLHASVAQALESNFGLLSTADGLAVARLRETAARSQFFPKLTPTYSRTTKDDQTFGLSASQRLPWSGASVAATGNFRAAPENELSIARTTDLRLTLTQPLLRGFGPTATNFELKNSRRAREGQERGFELARQRLAVDVTQAFYQVIRQRQLLEVSRRSLERSQGLLAASDARMKVGLASKLDVLRAQLEASQAQDGMVSAQAALETALETFRVLLGVSPTEPLEPETVTLSENVVAEPIEPTEVLIERAREQRLEIQETRDQVRDAERSAVIARQSLLPQLDLNFELAKTGFGPSFADSFRRADQRFVISFSTSYPLEHASDRANSAIAQRAVDAARRALRQREFEIEADVRAAVRTLERLKKSIDLQRQAVELANQQRRLATLRYQRGLESNFDVVDAERRLVLARNALVGLLTDYQVARVQLLRMTGGLDVEREFGP
jgi:outer membrane protein TolC